MVHGDVCGHFYWLHHCLVHRLSQTSNGGILCCFYLFHGPVTIQEKVRIFTSLVVYTGYTAREMKIIEWKIIMLNFNIFAIDTPSWTFVKCHLFYIFVVSLERSGDGI